VYIDIYNENYIRKNICKNYKKIKIKNMFNLVCSPD
jgi:hypothetical protein